MQRLLKLHIYHNPRHFTWDCWLRAKHPETGQVSVAENVTMRTMEPDSDHFVEPLFRLYGDDAVQDLMDSLWAQGVRPSRASSGDDTIEAHRDHIESLRRVQGAFLELVKRWAGRE